MSSILKALKKLEKENIPKATQSENESQNRTTEHTEHTKQKIKKKASVKQHIVFSPAKTYFFLFSFFLFLIIIIWLIIHSTGKLEKKQENSAPVHSTQNLSSTPNPSSQSPAVHDSTKPETPAPDPINNSITNSRPTFKIEEPVQPLAEHTPAGQTMNGRNENDHNNEDTNSNEIKNNTPGGLKLTGILWSEIKERRLALINELYLKEGDQVKGISIIRIDKNEVTLQSGVKTWTISLNK